MLGNSVQTIGNSAFAGAQSLTSLVIPDSVTTVGAYAFDESSNLTSLVVGNGVITIGDYAFYNKYSLRSLTLGNRIQTIGEEAFSQLPSLTSLTIPNSVTSIAKAAFYGGASLTTLNLGDNLQTIGDQAFEGASSLESLTIPRSVQAIGENAFSGLSALKVLRFEGNPNYINPLAFSNLNRNVKVYVPYGATAFRGSEWSDFTIIYFNSPLNIPTYQISYIGNASDVVALTVDGAGYSTGEKVAISARIPVRAGYTFLGWNTAVNGSGTSYLAGSQFTMGSANVSLYAQWKIKTYSLALNANGGPALGIDSQLREYASAITIPSLTSSQLRTGYTFLGWNTAADGSGQSYPALSTYSFLSDNTLFAQWKINTYVLSYNGNGHQIGRVPASSAQEFGSPLTINAPSQTFIRKGYTFKGWSTSIDASGITYLPGVSVIQPANDLFLYANWLPKTYQVKFLFASKSSIPNSEFIADGAIKVAPAPTRAGYIFKGWSNSPARTKIVTFPYSPGVMRNISLYAVWEKRK